MNFKDIIRKVRVQIIRTIASSKSALQLPDRAIIIAPHPDDEVIGCSGLIQQLLAAKKDVFVILMSGGGKSIGGIDEEALKTERRKLTLKAADVLGLSHGHITFLDYPDGSISLDCPETEGLREKLTGLLSETTAVFYPHREGEGWSDHITTSNIVQTLCKAICPEAKQYEYCVWFWFYNCWKIDWENAFITKMSKQQHQKKIQAMDEYILPLAPTGRPYSGDLPKVFVDANKWNSELYFKVSVEV